MLNISASSSGDHRCPAQTAQPQAPHELANSFRDPGLQMSIVLLSVDSFAIRCS